VDELHNQAASFSRVSITLADWRAKMLDCLAKEVPVCFATRYGIYKEAGIPEAIYQNLDASVLHTALNRIMPKVYDAESN
jgi:hypothetical protein